MVFRTVRRLSASDFFWKQLLPAGLRLRKRRPFRAPRLQLRRLLLSSFVLIALLLPDRPDALLQSCECLPFRGQLPVARQLGLASRQLAGQRVLTRNLFPKGLQSCLCRLYLRQQTFPLFACLRQLFPGLLLLLRLAEQRSRIPQLFIQLIQNLLMAGVSLPISPNQLFNQLRCLFKGKLPGLRLLQPRAQRLLLAAENAPDVLLDAGAGRLAFALQPSGFPLELFLENHIIARSENFPEDFLPASCIRKEQLLKVSLRNHGNLCELAPVEPDNAGNFIRHFPCLCDQGTIRQTKLRLRSLQRSASSAPGRPLVFRVPPHLIRFSAIGKHQFHHSRRFRIRIFGTEHGGFPVFAARLAVQSKGDSVKDGRLAGSRIPRNEIQPPFAQQAQIHLNAPGIGTESGYRQLQRSHLSPSQISSIRSAARALCSSPIGCPFCFS